MLSCAWGIPCTSPGGPNGTLVKQNGTVTHLVVYLIFRIGECHYFLEDLADLLELFALGPIVEGARHIYLLGIMGPEIPNC